MFLVAITSDFAIAPAPIVFADAWFLADWVIWVLSVLIGLIGLALALRGLFGDRARGRPHCYKCRYEMTGTQSLTCPECGHVNKSRPSLFKTRRYYKRFLLGALLFMLALYCHTGPQVQYRRGVLGEKWWESIVPTTVWIALLPSLEDERVEFLDKRVAPASMMGPPPGGSGFALFSDDIGEDLFSIGRELSQTTDRLPKWQADLLVNAVLKKREALRTSSSPGAGQGGLFDKRLVYWLIAVRQVTNVNDELIAIMNDLNEDVEHRGLAALHLGDQPPDRPVEIVVDALVAMLRDGQAGPGAFDALARLGARAIKAKDALDSLLKECRPGDQDAIDLKLVPSLRCLIHIDPTDPRPVLPLLHLEDTFIRAWAITALKEMAKVRRLKSLPVLAVTVELNSPHLNTQQLLEVYMAVRGIGVQVRQTPELEAAIHDLFVQLRSAEKSVQRKARDRFMEWRDEIVPLIEWGARQDNFDFHEECGQFVIYVGREGSDVATILVKSMLREPERFKHLMTEMVAHIGPAKPELLSVLLDALNTDDAETRDAARRALEAAHTTSVVVLPLIEERLKSKDVKVRTAMVRRLGEMALSNKDAVPVLRAVAERDESAEVRAAAEAALP